MNPALFRAVGRGKWRHKRLTSGFEKNKVDIEQDHIEKLLPKR